MAGRFVGSHAVLIDDMQSQLDEVMLAQIRQQEQLQKQSEQLQNPIAAKDIQQEKLDKVIRLVIRQQEQLQNQKEQLQNLRDDLYDKLYDLFDKQVSRKPKMTSKTGTVNAMKATKAMKSQKAKKAMKAIQIT